MKGKIAISVMYFLGIICFVGVLIACFSLPARVPMHINARGKIDYMGSVWFLLFPSVFPLLVAVLYNCTKKNFREGKKHRFALLTTVIGIQIFLIVCNAFMLMLAKSDLGIGDRIVFDFHVIIIFILSVWLSILAKAMSGLERNKFFGIRNKATLSSDEIWNKTHFMGAFCLLGGCLMMLLLCAFACLSNISWLSFVGVLLCMILSIVPPEIYSRKLYKIKNGK